MTAYNEYMKYRGKCREMCESAILEDPSLTLVRGHYYCPVWNTKEQHWWTVRPDGSIYDPTELQFPSAGMGDYIEFTGTLPCAECGRLIKEEDAVPIGNYMCCSTACCLKLVGLL